MNNTDRIKSLAHKKTFIAASLAAAIAGMASPVWAQTSGQSALALEEIVITARRRDESLQDVPLTVNAVTSEQIDDLNLRKVADLESVVAGLTLQEDTLAPTASLRGVRFETNASGNNATVEFYLDDAPIVSLMAMQAMFDVSQVEVLRGPQGTLRGRASPSGSITFTSQKPILDEFGGYIDATATDIDGQNYRGAINVPIVEDVLGVRLAGFWEENTLNDVENVFTGDNSEYEGKGYRFSVGYQPLDTLSINAQIQKVEPRREVFTHAESANIANGQLPASDIFIDAEDRLSVADSPQISDQEMDRIGLQATWEVGDQELNYVYSKSKVQSLLNNPEELDALNAVDASHPANLSWYGLTQITNTTQDSQSHELRLQSAEPLFGTLDYVVGFLYAENKPPSSLNQITPLAFFMPLAANPTGPNQYFGPIAYSTNATPIYKGGDGSEEQSFFANLTYHLSDATEVSAGIRRIDYQDDTLLIVNGLTLIGPGNVFGPAGDDGHQEWDGENVYSLSLKHSFQDNLMAYFSYGTSWRPGPNVIGDFSGLRSARQNSFNNLPPEESESFEIGMRSTWLDDRLRVNLSAYHQTFDNFVYRAGGDGIYYVSYGQNGAEVRQHNFAAAVPVDVNGIELENFYQLTDHWDIGALISYSKGEIDGGTIPCNDYLPADGTPDTGSIAPTVADIMAAVGSNNVAACTANFRANWAPLWTATLTSEYSFAVAGLDAYVRGLWTLYGDSDNDPSNPVDDVDAYNILSLYAGVSDPEGRWQAMIYGKNLLETEEVTTRYSAPGALNYTGLHFNQANPAASFAVPYLNGTVTSDYRQVALTAPREFGINLRYNF